MPSAQDIYDVLIKDPQYEGSRGLSREEVVGREAKRRARQHANNEKALSMAVQNSAIDKLFTFVNSRFLRKALDAFDKKLEANKLATGERIAAITEALQYFLSDPNQPTATTQTGWHVNDSANPEMMLITNRAGGQDNVSIYEQGKRLLWEKAILDKINQGLLDGKGLSEIHEEDSTLPIGPEDNRWTWTVEEARNLFNTEGQIPEYAHNIL